MKNVAEKRSRLSVFYNRAYQRERAERVAQLEALADRLAEDEAYVRACRALGRARFEARLAEMQRDGIA